MRPSQESPCQKSAIRRSTFNVASCPKTLTISKGLEELAGEVVRGQGQPVGKEVDTKTSEEMVPQLVPTSTRVSDFWMATSPSCTCWWTT